MATGGLSPFVPENDFEVDLLAAIQDRHSPQQVLSRLVSADVFVSSLKEMQRGDSAFLPLLADFGGRKAVVVFTALNRSAMAHAYAQHVVRLRGDQLILRAPPDMGVFLNPGCEAQLLLPADDVARFGRELRARGTQA